MKRTLKILGIAIDLFRHNEALGAQRSVDLARRILAAEEREDYTEMLALIQIALYSKGKRDAA